MKMKINTQQLIEVVNNDDEKYYLLLDDNNWIRISEHEYNKILEDDKNDSIQ